jgi:hypothetical protein
MTFANPAGVWAFAALVAVIVIHLLQRRRRRVIVSTLFLLEKQPAGTAGGRRLERLRRSASLFLQLAAAALLAFVLMLPLRLVEESRQHAVVVLDASVSMSAFRAPLRAALARRLSEIAGGAARTEWALLQSVPGRRPLYAGPSADHLLDALDAWEPREPHHDPAAALESARALAGHDGLVVFVTDHEVPLPEGFERLAVGSPIDNVGFVGVDVEAADSATGAPQIRAVVRNHGRAPVTRAFWAEAGGTPSEKRTIDLGPGEVKALTIPFPRGKDAVTLALEPDAFTLDDRAPVVRPVPKRLRVRVTAAEPAVQALIASLGALDVAEPAQIVFGPAASAPATTAPGAATSSTSGATAASTALSTAQARDVVPSVRWLPAAAQAHLTGGVVISESHPLVDGLAWHGAMVPTATGFERGPDDTVLVWSGPRPLVFLRGPHQLYLNFPLAGSNAERLPALLVLMHRFVESVRRDTVGEEHANFECHQALEVANDGARPLQLKDQDSSSLTTSTPPGSSPRGAPGADATDATSALPSAADDSLHAPWKPSFFEVRAGDAVRLQGATHFADVREADFTQASTSDLRVAAAGEVRRRHTRDDPWMPLWISLLGALLVADWGWAQRARG